LLRTDAAKELGMGHVYRTLALAQALARHKLSIVLSADKPLGQEFFAEYPFDVKLVENDLDLLKVARIEKADLVVLDRLDNAAEFVTLLGGFCKVVTFEDLGTGAEEADLLVSDLYENPRVPPERQLSGVENAILAPTFESIPRVPHFSEVVDEVLVLFGGTDPSGLAHKALEALDAIKFAGRVTVVRGLGADLIDPAAYKLKLKVLSNVKNMPAVMETADLALSSAGRTITELSSMGIPTICMAQNAKELTHTHTTTANGVIMLGMGGLVTVDTLAKHLDELIENVDLRHKLHTRAVEATGGRSNERIVRRILKQIGF
jgi:spore coat polysaccharide biosynthesis predicted glycosyltransferase SpsG